MWKSTRERLTAALFGAVLLATGVAATIELSAFDPDGCCGTPYESGCILDGDKKACIVGSGGDSRCGSVSPGFGTCCAAGDFCGGDLIED